MKLQLAKKGMVTNVRQPMLCLLAAIGMSVFFGSNIAAGAITSPKITSNEGDILSVHRISLDKKQIWNLSDLNNFGGASANVILPNLVSKEETLTPMDALDMVKEIYAANFEKVSGESYSEDDTMEEYYYKLPIADYYLVYEGVQEEKDYLIHLYEFVLDDPDTGIGHTVTYGWYTVDKTTGEIIEQMQY